MTAAIAVAVGVRAAIWTTPVPIFIRDVWAARCAPVGEGIVAPRLRDPDRVESELLRVLRALHGVGRRTRPPIPEYESELHDPPLGPSGCRRLARAIAHRSGLDRCKAVEPATGGPVRRADEVRQGERETRRM